MNCVVSFAQPIIASDMNGHRHLAGGGFGRINFSGTVESACHFDPEIDIHWRIAVGGMMVQEDVVPVGAKARLATQKRPDLIQGWAPRQPNRPDRDAPSDSGQFSCWYPLDRYDDRHIDIASLTVRR
jgi:hypothetical protein